jgi:hypothetical protein
LERDSTAPATVIAERIRTLGYDGGITIVKDYLQAVRAEAQSRRAYVRVEPGPGERFDVDWGHFGTLVYNDNPRKLYAFCLVECHSRKMHLEFTHSQSFETFIRCHNPCFRSIRRLRSRNLVRQPGVGRSRTRRQPDPLQPTFFGFLPRIRLYSTRLPCRGGLGKGQSGTSYRLRSPEFLASAQFRRSRRRQCPRARQWLQETANRRKHRETGQAPDERFQPEFLRPLPVLAPDYRDSADATVHKDLRLSFDGNRY